MKLLIAFIGIFLFSSESIAQNLLKERIWKISSRKRSIFLDKGVFHSEANKTKQTLVGVRNSYSKNRGYERIVFDFSSTKPPKVYGYISSKNKKLYLDFFNLRDSKIENKVVERKYLKGIDFFNVEDDKISLELNFNQKVSFDIFYLTNPARIVVDVKK